MSLHAVLGRHSNGHHCDVQRPNFLLLLEAGSCVVHANAAIVTSDNMCNL